MRTLMPHQSALRINSSECPPSRYKDSHLTKAISVYKHVQRLSPGNCSMQKINKYITVNGLITGEKIKKHIRGI